MRRNKHACSPECFWGLQKALGCLQSAYAVLVINGLSVRPAHPILEEISPPSLRPPSALSRLPFALAASRPSEFSSRAPGARATYWVHMVRVAPRALARSCPVLHEEISATTRAPTWGRRPCWPPWRARGHSFAPRADFGHDARRAIALLGLDASEISSLIETRARCFCLRFA